jgi:hypothetical protein
VDYLKFEIMRRESTAPVGGRFSIRFVICKRKNTAKEIDLYDGIL